MRKFLVLAIMTNEQQETIGREESVWEAEHHADAIHRASASFPHRASEKEQLLFYAARAGENEAEDSPELLGLHATLYLMKPGEELPPEMAALDEARSRANAAIASGHHEDAAVIITPGELQRLLRFAAGRWREQHPQNPASGGEPMGNHEKKGSHE
jgi:hypothetical protein